MRAVAAGTLPCLYRRMHERFLKLLLETVMAVQAELAIGARFQFKLQRTLLGIRERNDNQRNDYSKQSNC